MNLAVIIPAAGASKRFQRGLDFPRSKLDEDLGGRSVLQRAVELFTKDDRVRTIIVAAPHDEKAHAEFKLRYGDKLGLLGVTICRGGRTHRYETVAAALALLPDDATHVAVHDAARPCTPPELIERLLDAAARYPAVVPAIEVADALKRVRVRDEQPSDIDPIEAMLRGDDAPMAASVREIESTLPRDHVVAVQTPQVFEAALLRRAYAQQDLSSVDDAQLVERLGETITVVEGDVRNIKITAPEDVRLARAIIGVRAPEGRAVHKRF